MADSMHVLLWLPAATDPVAYDICPQARSGGETQQAMAIFSAERSSTPSILYDWDDARPRPPRPSEPPRDAR